MSAEVKVSSQSLSFSFGTEYKPNCFLGEILGFFFAPFVNSLLPFIEVSLLMLGLIWLLNLIHKIFIQV